MTYDMLKLSRVAISPPQSPLGLGRVLRLANDGDVPRATDEPGTFVRTVKVVDGAISIVWRWVTIIAIILGCGVSVGVTITQNKEIVKRLDEIGAANKKNTDDVTKLTAEGSARDREQDRQGRNAEALRERVQNVQTDINAIKIVMGLGKNNNNKEMLWAEPPAKKP